MPRETYDWRSDPIILKHIDRIRSAETARAAKAEALSRARAHRREAEAAADGLERSLARGETVPHAQVKASWRARDQAMEEERVALMALTEASPTQDEIVQIRADVLRVQSRHAQRFYDRNTELFEEVKPLVDKLLPLITEMNVMERTEAAHYSPGEVLAADR